MLISASKPGQALAVVNHEFLETTSTYFTFSTTMTKA